MGDRMAELFGCARHIDMDPLMIAGRFGELVHLGLGDLMPIGDPDLLPNQAFEVFKVNFAHRISSKARPAGGQHQMTGPLSLCWPGNPAKMLGSSFQSCAPALDAILGSSFEPRARLKRRKNPWAQYDFTFLRAPSAHL